MTPEEQRLKKNQELLESYNWYKDHHVCVRCRNATAVNGLVTCQKCRETMNENRRIRYAALTPQGSTLPTAPHPDKRGSVPLHAVPPIAYKKLSDSSRSAEHPHNHRQLLH